MSTGTPGTGVENPPDPCLEQLNALNQTDLEIQQLSDRIAADADQLIAKIYLRQQQQAALDACRLEHPGSGPARLVASVDQGARTSKAKMKLKSVIQKLMGLI